MSAMILCYGCETQEACEAAERCLSKPEQAPRVAKVIPYSGITRLDLPPERVLERAKSADLEGVVVIGYTKDGEEYAASSYADGGTVLWLLERIKARLIAVVDSENFG